MTAGRLDEKIAQAVEAQERIGELDALRAQAEELPGLLAEQELEQELSQAEAQLAHQFTASKRELREAAALATDWRERFKTAAAELETLAEELPKIQHKIFAALRSLQRAVEEVNETGWEPLKPYEIGMGGVAGSSYAIRAGRSVCLETVLAEAGAWDPRLSCWPEFEGDDAAVIVASLPWRLRELLRKGRGFSIFEPEATIRNLR